MVIVNNRLYACVREREREGARKRERFGSLLWGVQG